MDQRAVDQRAVDQRAVAQRAVAAEAMAAEVMAAKAMAEVMAVANSFRARAAVKWVAMVQRAMVVEATAEVMEAEATAWAAAVASSLAAHLVACCRHRRHSRCEWLPPWWLVWGLCHVEGARARLPKAEVIAKESKTCARPSRSLPRPWSSFC